MSTTQPRLGFQFKVFWWDNDVMQLGVWAWNGSFGGYADIYEAIGDLEAAAALLRGFPRSSSDTREVIFGNFDRKCAGGGVKMRFYCIDGAGHGYLEATIDSNFRHGNVVQTAVLSMPVEAAAVDSFVRELHTVGVNRKGVARLETPIS